LLFVFQRRGDAVPKLSKLLSAAPLKNKKENQECGVGL
jgi:hypothetical protein